MHIILLENEDFFKKEVRVQINVSSPLIFHIHHEEIVPSAD